MVGRLSVAQVRRRRLRAQLLSGDPAGDVASAVARVVGVQAQAATPARLAVRSRTSGSTADAVRAAIAAPRPSVVRSWAMRGTLHMVAARDLVWLTGLLGPLTIRSDARRRAQLGLTDRVCARALAVLPEIVTEPLTRAELVDRLNDAGVTVSRTGQAPPHLLLFAACSGVLCRGPDLAGDEPSYVLVEPWLPAADRRRALDRNEALRTLARRYLQGYGPASAEDLAAWARLPRADARAGIASLGAAIETVPTEIGELVALADHPGDATGEEPVVRLLGAFDTLLLGYRSRDWLLDSRYARQVQAGGGMIAATVLADGKLVGTWTLDRGARGVTVTVRPFARLPAGARARLTAEAEDVGRFLGLDARLRVGG